LKKEIKTKINIEKWIWKGDLLFRCPIDSILSGFYFEKSPKRKKEGYYIWKFNLPLVLLKENIHFTFGERLKHGNGEFWTYNNILDSIPKVLEIEKEKLIKKENLEYLLGSCPENENLRLLEAKSYLYSILDFDLSFKLCNQLEDIITKKEFNASWEIKMLKNLKEFLDKSTDERKDLLSNNRIQTAKNLGLEKYLLTL